MGERTVTWQTGSLDIEQQITQTTPMSSTPWQEVVAYVGLPPRLRGLRVLDVGAGASNTTAHLLSQGVDSYALDPHYNKRASVLEDLTKPSVEHLIRHGNPRQARAERIAMAEFLRSYRRFRERYIPASATAMPFEDDYFDIVFSVRTLSGYLDFDVLTFLKAMRECLRVTKSNGKIVLYPFETYTQHPDPNIRSRELAREQSHGILASHLVGRVQSADIYTMEIISDDSPGIVMQRQKLEITK